MKDPGLRACTPAARGLWIDLLCFMHLATKRGYLVIGDQTPTDAEAARVVGYQVDEYTLLLANLERFSVFSRTKNGTIFSRRMVRDEAKRKAWNTRQKRHRTKQTPYNLQVTERDIERDNPPVVTPVVTQMSRVSSSSSSLKKEEDTQPPGKRDKTQPIPRPKNPYWDSMVAVWGPPVTRAEQGRFGKNAVEFKDAEIDPSEIPIRYARAIKSWKTLPCSPEALLKHWSEFGSPNGNSNGSTSEDAEELKAKRQLEADLKQTRDHLATQERNRKLRDEEMKCNQTQ